MKPIDNTPENIIKFYNQLKSDVKGKDIKLIDANGSFRPLTVGNNYKAIDFTLYNTTMDGITVTINDDSGYSIGLSIKRFKIYFDETIKPETKKTFFEKLRSIFD